MIQQLWTAVDHYLDEVLVRGDAALDAALEASAAAGLPAINVAPNQGKLLHLLARLQGARSILEIGTLAGYSTIWLARALPAGGRVITLESEASHAELARSNLARAGVGKLVDVRVGSALDTLPRIEADGLAPFDFFFIDADKQNIPAYFEWSLKLARRGSLIVVDNVIREGAVLDTDSDDPAVRGVRRFNEMVAAEKRVSATAIQTVGAKGHDGFAIVLVVD
jgi:predicted O-methyltransferase YrrM